MERRYRWLGRWLLNVEPVGTAKELGDRIRLERDRLDKTGKGIAKRLAGLESFIDSLGELERASSFADRLMRSPDDRGRFR